MPAALINNSDEDNNFIRTHGEHSKACFSYPQQVAERGAVSRVFTNTTEVKSQRIVFLAFYVWTPTFQ